MTSCMAHRLAEKGEHSDWPDPWAAQIALGLHMERETLNQRWLNIGPASQTPDQYEAGIGSYSLVFASWRSDCQVLNGCTRLGPPWLGIPSDTRTMSWGCWSPDEMLWNRGWRVRRGFFQCWLNVASTSQTLPQHSIGPEPHTLIYHIWEMNITGSNAEVAPPEIGQGNCAWPNFDCDWDPWRLGGTRNPANARPIVGSMLGQRRRRWPNIDPTMGQRIVFAGNSSLGQEWRAVLLVRGQGWGAGIQE